jgi:hypothetical protein
VTKVAGPVLAVGATAAAVAGGLVLKERLRRKTVLGVPVPRTIGKPRVSNVDVKAVAKKVGEASTQFGQTIKRVSKDMERVGDQAERFGRLLS